MKFGDNILKYKDELFDDLDKLISLESVDGAKPDECKKALEFILARARDFGLEGELVTGQSAHVQLGSGGKLCGVLSHLDVVPAGNNWSVNPYALTEQNGRLYGRGIADDKGRIWKATLRLSRCPTSPLPPTANTEFALRKRV